MDEETTVDVPLELGALTKDDEDGDVELDDVAVNELIASEEETKEDESEETLPVEHAVKSNINHVDCKNFINLNTFLSCVQSPASCHHTFQRCLNDPH